MKHWSNSGSADAEIGNVNLKISGAMTVFGSRSDAGAGETPSLNRRKMRNLIPNLPSDLAESLLLSDHRTT